MADTNPKDALKIDGAIRIPASIKDGSIFRYWFEFLTPVHKLTEREIDVITSLVKQRYLLSQVIADEDILDRVTMSEDTKRKVREECKISLPHFQVIIGKLRKNNLIIDNKINKRYIPQISKDMKNFKYLLYFDLNDSE